MNKKEITASTSSYNFLTNTAGFLFLIQLLLFFLIYNFNVNIYFLGLGWLLLFPGFILVIVSVNRYQNVSDESNLSQPDQVVNSGIYSYVRHPMYLGWMIVSIAIALIIPQWFTIISSIVIVALIILEIRREEVSNVAKFGDDYVSYKGDVPMLNILLGCWKNLRKKAGGRYS